MSMKNVDLERVFDLLTHMGDRQTAGTPYKMSDTVRLTPKQQGKVFHSAIQAFMQSSGRVQNDAVIQAFSGSSDLPQLTKDAFNVAQNVPEYDTLWQKVFKGIPLRKGQLSWEVVDVATGLTFSLVPEGGKAKIYGISGSKITVGIEKYGAGLGVTWEMVEGRRLYSFVDQMMDVRAKLNDLWADIHYGLLAAAGAKHKIAYDTRGTNTVEKDVDTLNKAYISIGKANKDKSFGDLANARMQLYIAPNLKPRIMAALRLTNSDIVRSGADGHGVVEFGIEPNLTWNSKIPSNKGLLVVPGHKIQNSMYMQELGLQERDITTLSEMRTYWSAFGAVVADDEQVAEISFS